MATVRLAQTSDLKFYSEHLRRHGNESGREGDLIFSPVEEGWDKPFDNFEKSCLEGWSKSTTNIGWEKTWLITDSNGVYGDFILAHRPPLKSCLHRATLMMGIERSHRNQGFGSKMMEAGIAWAKSQSNLEWLQLFVFEGNEPAKKLYRKFGFVENGTTPDMFRVHGKQVADTSMILKLR